MLSRFLTIKGTVRPAKEDSNTAATNRTSFGPQDAKDWKKETLISSILLGKLLIFQGI